MTKHSTAARPKKPHPEDLLLAAEIASAREFTACLHLGPGQRHTERGFASYEAAREAADRMTRELSRFGRRAVVYAISARGYTIDCSPALVALAATL